MKSKDMENMGKLGKSLGQEVGKLFSGKVPMGTKDPKQISEKNR